MDLASCPQCTKHPLMPWMLCLSLVSLVACSTTYRKERPDLPRSERGTAELAQLYEDFEAAVGAKEFDKADDMLVELEAGVKDADLATIANRKFGLVSSRVDKASTLLKRARRENAIGLLTGEMQEQVTVGDTTMSLLEDEPPTQQRVEDLDKVVERLTELSEEGKQYGRYTQYKTYKPTLDTRLAAFSEAAGLHRWRVNAAETISDAIGDVAPIDSPTEGELDIDDQIDGADKSLEAYGSCKEKLEELRQAPGFAEEALVETTMGALSLADVETACEQRRVEAEGLGHNLRWQRDIGIVAAEVTTALKDVEAQEEPLDRLAANERAAEVLTACEAAMAKTEEHPGYDDKHRFASHMGKLTALKLRENCAKVGGRLLEQLPTWRWRGAIERLRLAIDEAKEQLKDAGEQESAEDKIEPLTAAGDAFEKCVEQAGVLEKRDEDGIREAKPTRKESKALKSMASGCRKQRQAVAKLLARATKATAKKQ